MKKTYLLLAIILVCASGISIAQAPKPVKDSVVGKSFVDSLNKAYADSIRFYKDSLKKLIRSAEVGQPERKEAAISINFATVIAFFVIIIILLLLFFRHLKHNNQRIGYQSIKLIGLILIFPGICILAIAGGEKILSGQTLSVLLGAIAGYVLSRDDDSKETGSKEATKLKDEYEKSTTEFGKKIADLEAAIQKLKEKNPTLNL